MNRRAQLQQELHQEREDLEEEHLRATTKIDNLILYVDGLERKIGELLSLTADVHGLKVGPR